MIKILSTAALSLSILVISYHIFGDHGKSDSFTLNQKVSLDIPIGIDEYGYPASCTDAGWAQSLTGKHGIATLDYRTKGGKYVRCLSRDEASVHMASLGVGENTAKSILSQYPVFK